MHAAKHYFISSRECTFSRTNFLKFVYSNKLQVWKITYTAVLSICSEKCCRCLQKCSLQFTHWHHIHSMNLFGVMKWLCYGLSNSIPTQCYVSVRSDEGTILSTLLHWVLAVCCVLRWCTGCVPSVNSGARHSGVIARSSLGRKRPA